eukprot:scaffold195382_cov16-Tisochrysis_lutea.AAC.4
MLPTAEKRVDMFNACLCMYAHVHAIVNLSPPALPAGGCLKRRSRHSKCWTTSAKTQRSFAGI